MQDFVGMDMARKFLQMGMTRAQRYANHKGGRKRDKDGNELPAAHDPVKAECAQIFRAVWEQAKQDPVYLQVCMGSRSTMTHVPRDSNLQPPTNTGTCRLRQST